MEQEMKERLEAQHREQFIKRNTDYLHTVIPGVQTLLSVRPDLFGLSAGFSPEANSAGEGELEPKFEITDAVVLLDLDTSVRLPIYGNKGLLNRRKITGYVDFSTRETAGSGYDKDNAHWIVALSTKGLFSEKTLASAYGKLPDVDVEKITKVLSEPLGLGPKEEYQAKQAQRVQQEILPAIAEVVEQDPRFGKSARIDSEHHMEFEVAKPEGEFTNYRSQSQITVLGLKGAESEMTGWCDVLQTDVEDMRGQYCDVFLTTSGPDGIDPQPLAHIQLEPHEVNRAKIVKKMKSALAAENIEPT